MKMRFLPDTPIKSAQEDVLHFGPFVDLIEQSIKNTEPPFVYGVLGDWGTGKTSILQLLRAKLEDSRRSLTSLPPADPNRERPFIPIWFNAWKYENEANIIYPLLYAIKGQYERDIKDEGSEAFQEKFRQVAATSALALGDIGLRTATNWLTGQGIGLTDLQDHLKTAQEHPGALEAIFTGWADEVNKLETAFRLLLKTYAEDVAQTLLCAPETIRFVILIDDLDRCLPETTIAILEGIKNYLAVEASEGPEDEAGVERPIFVLALNAKVVYQGIKAKYRGLEIDGREYLEKILNYSFYVPEPELERVKAFATGRLNDLVEAGERGRLEADLSEFGAVLEACKFNNPRKIKRVLNRYLLFISRYETDIKHRTFELDSIVRLIVLAEYYPVLFQLVYGSDQPKAVLQALGTATKYADLKERYDLTIPASYPPLFRVQPLFENKSHNLRQEVDAVFSLTRLV